MPLPPPQQPPPQPLPPPPPYTARHRVRQACRPCYSLEVTHCPQSDVGGRYRRIPHVPLHHSLHQLTLRDLICLAEENRRLAEENQATRGKLEQLRVVMEERRARRRARREARTAPYSAAWSAKNGAASPVNATSGACQPGAAFGGVQTHGSTASLDSISDNSMDTTEAATTAELVRELNTEPVVA